MILKAKVITVESLQFHIKIFLKRIYIFQFLEKPNKLYLMHWRHLKRNIDLPASYSAKQKKYWPILYNCHCHCAKKEVIYREFVIVKSCLVFWCKGYWFPPCCMYFQHFISIAYSREKDLNATCFGPHGWTKASHNKGFISIGQGKKNINHHGSLMLILLYFFALRMDPRFL